MMHLSKLAVVLVVVLASGVVLAQDTTQDRKPFTSQEIVSRLYQLQRSPDTRDEFIEELRKRGIGFQLTDGMRSLIATKSGNDALLRRTFEEAERRRVNLVASSNVRRSKASLPLFVAISERM